MYFNSIKVRLEHKVEYSAGVCCINFNSIKVRLEHMARKAKERAETFQFHKGTIRTQFLDDRQSIQINFNSIKVRLELWQVTLFGRCTKISIP